MGRLVSVNVGMPKDVQWRDKTVHTGVWKTPVDGPVMVRRLNIDGDGQGDLAGHGGEQRAVMVYQSESYDFWKTHLRRDDLEPGNFGENFTVAGLADDEVCIGDRYRIGDAEFEVTQPRVTCFRIGVRLNEPEMPNLPADASTYLCGPTQFMTDMRDALTAAGLDAAYIHSELFGALPPINPGIVDTAPRKPPHPPSGTPGAGPPITFARSGLTVNWSSDYGSILDLAEACDVPTRFACRSGVCHVCETGVVAGGIEYVQAPLEPPDQRTVLICSAAPTSDLVLDL